LGPFQKVKNLTNRTSLPKETKKPNPSPKKGSFDREGFVLS